MFGSQIFAHGQQKKLSYFTLPKIPVSISVIDRKALGIDNKSRLSVPIVYCLWSRVSSVISLQGTRRIQPTPDSHLIVYLWANIILFTAVLLWYEIEINVTSSHLEKPILFTYELWNGLIKSFLLSADIKIVYTLNFEPLGSKSINIRHYEWDNSKYIGPEIKHKYSHNSFFCIFFM